MKRDKARYMIVYVLYPALKVKHRSISLTLPWFIVSFCESLNLRQQKCEMNVNICYWDGGKNVAQSVYYDSQFLQMPNAVNLKKEVLNAIKDLDTGKFLHLGMDEARKNWNVLDFITDHQVAIGFQKTYDIGSCWLHNLHGAFQTGMIKHGWYTGKILKPLFKIFD